MERTDPYRGFSSSFFPICRSITSVTLIDNLHLLEGYEVNVDRGPATGIISNSERGLMQDAKLPKCRASGQISHPQSRSFEAFFSRDPQTELNMNRIERSLAETSLDGNRSFRMTRWELDPPPFPPEECVRRGESYRRELRLVFQVSGPPPTYPVLQFEFGAASIPVPTPSGEFILAGRGGRAHRKVLVMQLVRSPGLHWSAKDGRIRAVLVPLEGDRIEFEPPHGKFHGRIRIGDAVTFTWAEFLNLVKDGGNQLPTERIGAMHRYLRNGDWMAPREVMREDNGWEMIVHRFRERLFDFDFGKRGIGHMADCLPQSRPQQTTLGPDDLAAICQRAAIGDVKPTDFRSLENLKVRLIGDILFPLLDHAARRFVSAFVDRYALWTAAKPGSRLDAERARRLAGSEFRAAMSMFLGSPLLQILDSTNPLSEASHKRRLTFRGPGGLNRESLYLGWRDVHESDKGRLCPIETPQGDSLGLNLHLATDATVSPDGELEMIGRESGSASLFGWAGALIPFVQHNDASRALMAAGMMKQALPLVAPEMPWVTTGAESGFVNAIDPPEGLFIKDRNLCLGRNLLVGYMPWDLLNTEDAVVLGDQVVRGGALNHVEEIEISCDEVRSFENGIHEEITKDNPEALRGNPKFMETLSDQGIVLEGVAVEPGDVLVSKLRERPTNGAATMGGPEDEDALNRLILALFRSDLTPAMEDGSLRVPPSVRGTITRVDEIRSGLPPDVLRRVVVRIRQEKPIRVGDKLSGRHGNKGVVGAILPEREMPFRKWIEGVASRCTGPGCPVPEPHEHLDILLNPLTITGRMNLGQLYETALASIARTKGLSIQVPPFSSEWTAAKIRSERNVLGIPEKEVLFYWDPNSKNEVRIEDPITMGPQYFVKLDHQAEKKLKSRAHAWVSPSDAQPTVHHFEDRWQRNQANREKAQRLGEMEVWALAAHGAWNLLDELLFVKSDAEFDRWRTLPHGREKKSAVRRFLRLARANGWNARYEKTDGTVALSGHAVENRSSVIRRLGFREQELSGDQTRYSFAPETTPQREHRAFKNFVHYARVLGFEVVGLARDEEDGAFYEFEMAGWGSPPWPVLEGVSIHPASARRRPPGHEVTEAGDGKSGLWSASIFGQDDEPEDKPLRQDATGFIRLAVPVVNDLLLNDLRLVLDEVGYRWEQVSGPFRDALTEIGLWNESIATQCDQHGKRYPLEPVEDLLDWFESNLTEDLGRSWDRDRVRAATMERLSGTRPIRMRTALDRRSSNGLPPSALQGLVERLDWSRLIARSLKQTERNDSSTNSPSGARDPRREKRMRDRRLGLLRQLAEKNIDPSVFLLKEIVVLPKALRHERDWGSRRSGRQQFTHDLNVLYRRVIETNRRITNFQRNRCPDGILAHEEKRLQDSVRALLMSGSLGSDPEGDVRDSAGRILVGVLARLTGITDSKQGLFRKSLLGKRVEFSGRGVIVPDPSLGLDEAGLPVEVGVKLFRSRLVDRRKKEIQSGQARGLAAHDPVDPSYQEVEAWIDDPENADTVQKWLNELSERHFVLLNRAPSLHRLSLLAFHPRFFPDAHVIRLNPVVCTPFNADFDGDTMALHVPALPESIREASGMVPSRALRSPGSGRLVINVGSDFALAWHLRCSSKDADFVSLLSGIPPVPGNAGLQLVFEEWSKNPATIGEKVRRLTTLFRETLKKSGLSLGIGDFDLDEGLPAQIEKWRFEIGGATLRHDEGKQREQEWKRRVHLLDQRLRKRVHALSDQAPLRVMMESGAARTQLLQICGLRGFMHRPGGARLAEPVCTNLLSGMTLDDFFLTCHGSRSGLVDKGLMTGPAGDLTNILVQACDSDRIVEEDCGSSEGIWLSEMSVRNEDGETQRLVLSERIVGRVIAEDIHRGDLKIPAGTRLDDATARRIEQEEIQWVKVRSPLTCRAMDVGAAPWKRFVEEVQGQTLANPIPILNLAEGHVLDRETLDRIGRIQFPVVLALLSGSGERFVDVPPLHGLCRKCYGADPSTGRYPSPGHPAGVIAAQSIGEPGTQLTLSAFHKGGASTTTLPDVKRALRGAGIPPPESAGEPTWERSPNGMFWGKLEGIRIPAVASDDGTSPVLFQSPVTADRIASLHGLMAAAEFMTTFLQTSYSGKRRVADVHFEIVVRQLMRPFVDEDGRCWDPVTGLSGKPSGNLRLTPIHRAALRAPGFLAGLGFQRIGHQLAEAGLQSKTDWLRGIKARVIAGCPVRPEINLRGEAT